MLEEDQDVLGMYPHLAELDPEGWQDRATFESHVASPHMKVWRAAGASLGITDRNLKIYEAGDPKSL